MYATRDKKIKTDKRDAHTLRGLPARSLPPGASHFGTSAQDLSAASYQVNTCSKYISLIGSLARREGCRIATGGSNNFVARVEAAGVPKHVMAAIAPLFESLKMLNRQIGEADAELEQIVREDEVVRRLCTAPGVGPVTATTFAATIDDASRFGAAKQMGLTSAWFLANTVQESGNIGGASARQEAAAPGHYSSKRHGRCCAGGRRRTKLSMIGR